MNTEALLAITGADRATYTTMRESAAYFLAADEVEGNPLIADRLIGRDLTKVTRHVLTFTLPNDKADAAAKVLEDNGFNNNFSWSKRMYMDNGLSGFVSKKFISCSDNYHPAVVVKQPWFDQVLAEMQKFNPDMTEESFIALDSNFNFNSMALISYTKEYCEYSVTYDTDNKEVSLYIMNEVVPRYVDKIATTIAAILAL